MKKHIPEGTKKELLDIHFHYEVRRIMEDIPYVNIQTGQIPEVVLVDFLVHIRILYEFFYGFGKGDRAHAGHYIKSWKNKQSPREIKDWNIQINHFLSHLTYERVNRKYKPYTIFMLYGHYRKLVIDFLNELSEGYMSKILKKLLEDLEQKK